MTVKEMFDEKAFIIPVFFLSLGGGFLSLLSVILKLLNQINYSWWWVLSPLWMPIVVFFTSTVVCYILDYIFPSTENNKLPDDKEDIEFTRADIMDGSAYKEER